MTSRAEFEKGVLEIQCRMDEFKHDHEKELTELRITIRVAQTLDTGSFEEWAAMEVSLDEAEKYYRSRFAEFESDLEAFIKNFESQQAPPPSR